MGWKPDRERGNRHQRGYGTAWEKLRKYIIERDDGLCQSCMISGRISPGSEVDHITPKAKGGTDDESNLQLLCTPCHAEKTLQETGRKLKPIIGLDGWPIEQ